jgi:hypothetical protein
MGMLFQGVLQLLGVDIALRQEDLAHFPFIAFDLLDAHGFCNIPG